MKKNQPTNAKKYIMSSQCPFFTWNENSLMPIKIIEKLIQNSTDVFVPDPQLTFLFSSKHLICSTNKNILHVILEAKE